MKPGSLLLWSRRSSSWTPRTSCNWLPAAVPYKIPFNILKWMIWGYPYFMKPPYDFRWFHQFLCQMRQSSWTWTSKMTSDANGSVPCVCMPVALLYWIAGIWSSYLVVFADSCCDNNTIRITSLLLLRVVTPDEMDKKQVLWASAYTSQKTFILLDCLWQTACGQCFVLKSEQLHIRQVGSKSLNLALRSAQVFSTMCCDLQGLTATLPSELLINRW